MRKNPIFKSLAFVGAWMVADTLICITSLVGARVLTAILSSIVLVSMCLVLGYMYSKFERFVPLAEETPMGEEMAEPVITDKDLESL